MKKIMIVILLLTMGLLGGCGTKEDTFTIGFIGTLTGTYASVGTQELYGVQFAIDEINEAGGINGKTVELEIRDDQADPQKAVELDNELYEMGIDIIIGHSLSIVAIEVMENTEDKDILFLSPSIGTDTLSNLDDGLIRNVATTYNEGYQMTEEIVDDNPSNVLFLYNLDNFVLTQHHKIAFEEVMAMNGYNANQYTTLGFHTGDDEDHIEIENQLDSGNFDTVMFVGSNIDASPVVNYISSNDIDVDIHLSSWASTGLIERIDTEDTDNIYAYIEYLEQDDDEDFVQFHDQFVQKYGEDVQMLVVNAYDLIYLLKAAVEQTNSTEPQDVKSAIIEIGTFDGIAGQFTINEFGDCERPNYQMIIVDGKYVLNEE
jgi:branched-chain amino acid transport system substrate-binding protein